eukprot:CAMPEP_0175142036 /NCGR_PEP_ID=MMETSP0087-20121206/12517_1 /TAXON_ID=136419 /ORGANISM="Unknown Unknown, Strain D1" /LENGTH=262 /DNA_ID=CAMNT_0016425677 /DNA_START=31 /DNA_END=819 /DNA_ORIENTATION=-
MTAMQHLSDCGRYCAVMAGGFAGGFAVTWGLFCRNRPTLVKQLQYMDVLFSVPYYPVLVGAAISSVFENGNTATERMVSMGGSAETFLYLYISKQLVHLPVQFFTEEKRSTLIQMTVHHIISIVGYSSAIYGGKMGWYAGLAGCCEVTTIFLNNLFLFKEFGWHKSKPRLTAVNGITLWLSFIFFRLVLFSYWFWRYIKDVLEFPDVYNKLMFGEKLFYPLIMAVLFGLSLFWFTRITQGMLKAIKGTATEADLDNRGEKAD